MRHSIHLIGILLAGTAMTSAPALAAEAPASGEQGITDIVVTASRHEQNLQKVSASVSVIGGESLQDKAAANLAQIFDALPSVQTTAQPGGFSVNVRGMGGDLPAGTAQGASAVVIDGVYNVTSQGTTVGLFDVNRVEVLPGPQSTRYGPNADGGLVNIYTNDPKLNKLEGNAAITVGNYGLVRGEVALNVPLGEKLALRVAGAAISRDSYFHPAQGDQKGQSLRVKLLYKPNDALSLKLSYEVDHVGGAGNGSNVFPVLTNKVPVYSGDSINNTGDPWAQSPSSPVNTTHTSIYQHAFGASGSYDFGNGVALDAQGSYTMISGGETANIYLAPWSTTFAPFQNATLKEFDRFNQYTGEVRLHNGAGSKVLWNVGFYHWNYLWGFRGVNSGVADTDQDVVHTTSTNALFGEVTYPITDRLRAIVGLRQSWDRRTDNFQNGNTVTQTFGISMSHADYRAGLEYDVAPRSMVYGTVSTGYRPGGQSAYNPVLSQLYTFQSEVNTAFEVGSKNRFFDNRLQFNAAMFYYKISNYQNLDKYNGFDPHDGSGIACANGDVRAVCTVPTFGMKAHTFGIDASLIANITNDDVVSLSGTYLDARFDKKQGTCATVGLTAAAALMGCADGYNDQNTGVLKFFDAAGAVQPHSPKLSFNFAYNHTFRFASGATFKLGGNAFHSSGYWVNPVQDDAQLGYQPAYWMGTADAKYVSPSGRYSIGAFVKNIGNYAVKQSVLPATSIGDPRTYGATFAVKF